MKAWLKKLIIGIVEIVCENWVAICGILALLLVFNWLIGYHLQGIYGFKYDLASVWVGVGVLMGAAVLGAGKELAKYWVDSKYNTEHGQKPE